MYDREIPWDDLSPGMQEQLLKANRAIFQDPDWLPPEGMTIGQTTIPEDFLTELDADRFAARIAELEAAD